jgi:hypothetical protein
VNESTKPITPTDVEVRDAAWVGDWLREGVQWSGVGDASVWPVAVVATRSRTL